MSSNSGKCAKIVKLNQIKQLKKRLTDLGNKSRLFEESLNLLVDQFKDDVKGCTVSIWLDDQQIRVTLCIDIDRSV